MTKRKNSPPGYITPQEAAVLTKIKGTDYVTSAQMAQMIGGIRPKTAAIYLGRLSQQRLVSCVGYGVNARWRYGHHEQQPTAAAETKPKPYKAPSRTADRVRARPPTPDVRDVQTARLHAHLSQAWR